MLSLRSNIWKTFVCFARETNINIPFGAIIELINKTQDKWIFLAELWQKLFRAAFSNCTTNGKSLIFSYNPASDFPFIGRWTHKKCSCTTLGIRKYIEMGTERFFNLSFELWYFHPQTLFDVKQKGIYRILIFSFLCFPAFQFSFSIHYENVASTTSHSRYDKSNDCKIVRWRKENEKVERKSRENLAKF